VIFEPEDFIARLAALVPKLRANLTRYHGVLAPASPDQICRSCGGKLRVIASIEDSAVIERILGHLGRDAGPVDPAHPSRAPPQGDLSL
jgi:hypothetical protein